MNDQEYETLQDTLAHIRRVQRVLSDISNLLVRRGVVHDQSKLRKPEFGEFARLNHLLSQATYGSDQYQKLKEELDEALDHHYEMNAHHPEHYEDGIEGMSLLDVIEMLADWKAASERHDDGDILESIDHNRERFEIDEQLAQILINTVEELGWSVEFSKIDTE